NNYLFGDLLKVNKSDLIIIFLGDLFVISILVYRWNSLLLATINEELAKIDGINLYYDRLTIMLTTAVTMSIAIKFVGALLVTSLLIIPPAIAQNFSGSPEKMVIFSIIFSIISIIGGIYLSILCHTPTSPSIVLFLSFFYFLSNF
ncbi:metal ABC transporter permease, partial [Buchnera aphidicola]|nr:metal ABC transporter permease [Buchnera aphidicola]